MQCLHILGGLWHAVSAHTEQHASFVCGLIFLNYYYNLFIPITFFSRTNFKLFISLEYMYNKLPFGIRISSIGVGKLKLRIISSLYVYDKMYSKEIHPGVSPFSKAKGFRVFSSKHWCLCRLPQQKSFQRLQ